MSQAAQASQIRILEWVTEYVLAQRFDEVADHIFDILVNELNYDTASAPFPIRLRVAINTIRGDLKADTEDKNKTQYANAYTVLYKLKDTRHMWAKIEKEVEGMSEITINPSLEELDELLQEHGQKLEPISAMLENTDNQNKIDLLEKFKGKDITKQQSKQIFQFVERLLACLSRLEKDLGAPMLERILSDITEGKYVVSAAVAAPPSTSTSSTKTPSKTIVSQTSSTAPVAEPPKATPHKSKASTSTTPRASQEEDQYSDKITVSALKQAAGLSEEEFESIIRQQHPEVKQFLTPKSKASASKPATEVIKNLRSGTKDLKKADPLKSVLQQMDKEFPSTTNKKRRREDDEEEEQIQAESSEQPQWRKKRK
jgi:hypothetical protein